MLNETIIVDTREQTPWDLEFYGFKSISKKLDFGDYSVVGYEDKIAIERKSSNTELANNLGKYYKRFLAEMKLMQYCELKIIICEFPKYKLEEYPKNTVLTKKQKAKATPGYILVDRLNLIEDKFNIKALFFNNRHEAEMKVIEELDAFFTKHKR